MTDREIDAILRAVSSCRHFNEINLKERCKKRGISIDLSWGDFCDVYAFVYSLETRIGKKIPLPVLYKNGIKSRNSIHNNRDDYGGKPIFITYDMLLKESHALIDKIPEIKGVIGCPRSGMVPAGVIANALSIPLYSFSEGSVVKLHSSRSDHGGSRMRMFQEIENLPILVVDDSCFTGVEMNLTKKTLEESNPNENFIYATIFCLPESKNKVDFCSKTVSYPHIFEWNIFDADPTKKGVLDMDGVLCGEIPYDIAEDETAYRDYIRNIPPIKQNLPVLFGCKAVCTGRLEKYRDITEEWLARNNVGYKKLIMFPGTKEERDRDHDSVVSKYKTEEFSKIRDARFFVESSDIQSRKISENLIKLNDFRTVICPTSKRVY